MTTPPALAWRFDARAFAIALAAFGVGSALELGQHLAQRGHWQIANPVLHIVVGSTPDWLDVLAYGIGAAAVVVIERRIDA